MKILSIILLMFLVLMLSFMPAINQATAADGDSNVTNLVASGDITAGDDLTVVDNATIGGTLVVIGTLTSDGKILTAAAIEAGGVIVAASASGTHYVLTGSTAETFTLPAAVAGLNYGFIVGATGDLKIDCQTGDQIQVLTNATGDSITNTTAGGGIYLFAVDGTSWYARSQNGTWSDTN